MTEAEQRWMALAGLSPSRYRGAEADEECAYLEGLAELTSKPSSYRDALENVYQAVGIDAKHALAISSDRQDISRISRGSLSREWEAEALNICASDRVMLIQLAAIGQRDIALRMAASLPARAVRVAQRLAKNLHERLQRSEHTGSQAENGGQSLNEAIPLVDARSRAASGVAPILFVLSAGRGTRLRTTVPKAAIPLGRTIMAQWIREAALSAGIRDTRIVVGEDIDLQLSALRDWSEVVSHVGARGTADTARMALSHLAGYAGPIYLSFSDTPLLLSSSFDRLMTAASSASASFALSVYETERAEGGSVIRDGDGFVERVEQVRLGAESSGLVDGGLYVAPATMPVLLALGEVRANDRSEFSLPDVVKALRSEGRQVAAAEGPPVEFIGVNTPADLLRLRDILALTNPPKTSSRDDVGPAFGARIGGV